MITDLQIVFRRPESLRAYERNARTHSEEQIGQLARSIEVFGFTNPVLITDEDQIVAGHGRVEAAKRVGLAEVPCLIVGQDWSPDQLRAYVLADNQIAINAGWNMEALSAELNDLRVEDFNLDLIGFNNTDLALIFGGEEFANGANDADAEWKGMPEFDQKDKTAFRSLAVHFKNQAAVDDFAELIGQTITDKTRFVWFPKIEIETYADKRYSCDEPAIPDLHPEQGAAQVHDNVGSADRARRSALRRRRAPSS